VWPENRILRQVTDRDRQKASFKSQRYVGMPTVSFTLRPHIGGVGRLFQMNNLSSGTERTAEILSAKADQTERQFYRFFTFDAGGRIALAEDHECDSDRSALALGQNLLAGKNCPKIEVWFRKARIGVLEKAAPS
jgi:hypothetical protein